MLLSAYAYAAFSHILTLDSANNFQLADYKPVVIPLTPFDSKCGYLPGLAG
jgi:hypothetical protein